MCQFPPDSHWAILSHALPDGAGADGVEGFELVEPLLELPDRLDLLLDELGDDVEECDEEESDEDSDGSGAGFSFVPTNTTSVTGFFVTFDDTFDFDTT
ncbi:hypothetical protein GCM10027344_04650 [Spelaeicoccus albus]